MQKTDSDKKTIKVIDEYGNTLESTYPKRAKGLVKSGRARYVDENTILLLTVLPINNNLEEQKMNNNENKTNIIEQSKTISMEYIINKIDEIIKMNQEALTRTDLAGFSNVPGTKSPIQSICETNNKMIDLLREMYLSIQPKEHTINDKVLSGLTEALNNAIIEASDEEVISTIASSITDLVALTSKR